MNEMELIKKNGDDIMKKLHRLIFTAFILFTVTASGIMPENVRAEEPLLVKKAKKPVQLTGFTRSIETVAISPEVSGKLTKVNYDVGDVIGKAPFFTIDTTFIDLDIQKIKVSLNQLDVTFKKSASKIAYLQKEFTRIDTLHKGDRATEAKRDEAAEALDQATLEHESLSAEKAGLETQLKELLERKKRFVIQGPENWIVIEKLKSEGELVNAYAPIAKASDFQKLVVPLYVSSEEYKMLRSLESPFPASLEDRDVRAEIHKFNPEFDEKTRKLAIELLISDYEGEKRGGLLFSMPVEIEWKGLLIPKEAVVNRYENPRITLKASGETINVLILGEVNGDFVISENSKIKIGDELVKQ